MVGFGKVVANINWLFIRHEGRRAEIIVAVLLVSFGGTKGKVKERRQKAF